MSETDHDKHLKHALHNAQAENIGLRHIASKAAEQLDRLVESECDEAEKTKASQMAERIHRAGL